MKRRAGLQAALLVALCSVVASTALAQEPDPCVRGKPTAPIRIEVFSDYQCPACRAFYLQTMKQVFVNYADQGKVCIVYKEFPAYQYSRAAALLARAARRVGVQQWGLVTEALFQSQPEWGASGNVEGVVASALGPKDMVVVRKHLEDPALDDDVDRDALLGLRREVVSTPTMFISGGGKFEKVEGALTYGAMQRRLDALLP